MRYVLGAAVWFLFGAFFSPANAEGRSVRFAEDPLLLQGSGFHARVESQNISVQDNECLVYVYFPDGNIEGTWVHEAGSYLGESVPKQIFQKIRFDEDFLDFPEVVDRARGLCWPEH